MFSTYLRIKGIVTSSGGRNLALLRLELTHTSPLPIDGAKSTVNIRSTHSEVYIYILKHTHSMTLRYLLQLFQNKR